MIRKLLKTLPCLLTLGFVGSQSGCKCQVVGVEDAVPSSSDTACQAVGAFKAVLILDIVAGDNQTAQVGTVVGQPIVARLRDATAADVPGVEILFDITSGGGRFAGSLLQLTVVTDAQGRAVVPDWSLGPLVGTNTIRARMNANDPVFNPGGRYYGKYFPGQTSNDTLSRTVTAQGTAGPPNKMSAAASPTQGPVNQPVSPKPAVKVTDAFDNPLAGIAVAFVAVDGSVTGGSQVTDAAGVATVGGWTLGTTATSQRLVATASGSGISGNPIDFVVQAVPASAGKVTPVTAISMAAQPGATITPEPAVKVVDQFDNPVAGADVTFAVGSTGGTVAGAAQTTNSLGVATVGGWIVGSGQGVAYTLTATVGGSGITNNPVVFTATTASNLTLAISAGDNQSAAVNRTVAVAPQVRVTDAHGKGVAGVVITWTVVQGSGSFLATHQPTTDGQGYAAVDYFSPTTTGAIRLRASTTDRRVQPAFVEFKLTGL
jgi:adhesin/invasin